MLWLEAKILQESILARDDFATESSDFVHTDVARDVLASLDLLELSLAKSMTDRAWWKWVVVSAHMAVGTSLVGYLTGSSGLGALDDKSTQKWIEWHEQPFPREDPPREHLAPFPTLLKRAANGEQGFNADGPIELGSSLLQLRKLNSLRSQFVHFLDIGWMIEIAYIQPMLRASVHLVSLVEEHGWAFRHASDPTRERLRAILDRLKKWIDASGGA